VTIRLLIVAALLIVATPADGLAQEKTFKITDNSFFVEEAFNQERGIFQNIFVWTRAKSGGWNGSFTQEWPAPAMAHQLSYTVPFFGGETSAHIGGVLLNYRYQALEEGAGRPAFSPRISLILPSGRALDDSDHSGLQGMLPFSKQVGEFYLHGNAGLTWIHGVSVEPTRRTNLTSPQLAGSVVWNTRPMLNLLFESVVVFEDAVRTSRETSRERVVTLSPGLRGGWNLSGDRQIIVGVAVPVTVTGGEKAVAFLTYFSYELPFTANH
jgi:hypothetical protein